MPAFKLILLGFLGLLGTVPAALAQTPPAPTVTVVEYYDGATGKFFMTADPAEQGRLDAAGVDSPRVRTGLQFDAYPADVDTCETRAGGQVVCAVAIVRFDYAAFDWFFYSPKPSEWAQLLAPGSGFIDRGVAFKAFQPDGPGNTCTQGRVAVYRSYRNQNHRFPADQATHQRMITTGSENEGVTFCVPRARINALFDSAFVAEPRGGVVTPEECRMEVVTGSCLVARNLVPPRFSESEFPLDDVALQPFLERTGFNGRVILTEGDARLSDRALGSFVQFGAPGALGLHVNTGNRIAAGPVALDAVVNLERFSAPGSRDARLLPFRAYDVPTELSTRFLVFVKAVDATAFGSRVDGRLRIVFQDVSDRRFDINPADRRLDFVVQIYGDRFPFTDSVTVEGATITSPGQLVLTTSGERSTFGRLVRPVPFLMTPGGFRSGNAWGYGDAFDYRIDRAAMQRIIDVVRQRDSTYSADPARYQVLSYRIENEADGPARLGLNTREIGMQLLRKP